jgi:hypothetical protein
MVTLIELTRGTSIETEFFASFCPQEKEVNADERTARISRTDSLSPE